MTQTTAPTARTHTLTPQPPARQLCPYCGHLQAGTVQCEQCRGLFEPLSRQATQNSMGPWQVRDPMKPFAPGCSLDTIRQMIARGRITSSTIIRGPTTRQFWHFAIDVPGVAVLLGRCHACRASVATDDYMCRACGAVLSPTTDRQHLGLAAIQPLSGAPTAPASAVEPSFPVPPSPQAPGAACDAGTLIFPASPAPDAAHGSSAAARPPTIAEALAIPADPPGAGTATARALRRELAAMRAALGIALVLAVLLACGLAYVLIDRTLLHAAPPASAGTTSARPAAAAPPSSPAESSIAPTTTDPSATTPPEPAAPSSPPAPPAPPVPPVPTNDLDAALGAWAREINQAAELAKQDSKDSIKRAIEILRHVREQATAAAGTQPSDYPLLAARLAALEARLDKITLREMF